MSLDASANTTTTTLLLDGLKDAANHSAWRTFHDRYVPIMVGFARKLGLNDADAADVVQDALVRFVREYQAGRYDRGRGRLRSWLMSIVRFRVADARRAQAAAPAVTGSSMVTQLPGEDELERLWDAEQRRTILRQAFDELRNGSRLAENTIRAFERLIFDEQPAAAVAVELGMTPQDVYMAKSRVYERLAAIVKRLEALYEDA